MQAFSMMLIGAAVQSASAFAVGGSAAVRMTSGISMQVSAPAPEKVKDALKSIKLTNSAGDSAEIYTFGACVTSYVKGGIDALMIRPDAKMDGSKPISGGIPHCFPQFGPGAIQQHGFARNLDWDVVEVSESAVTMKLTENEYTLSMWPYAFEAIYEVALKDDRLSTELAITNTGDQNFDFTTALHTYFSVSDVDKITIKSDGFDGASFLDKTASPPETKPCTSTEVKIGKETDSVYAGVAGEVAIVDPRRSTAISTYGWSDTVVWNPYGDEGMGYKEFVCVEAAQASKAIILTPSEYWSAQMDVIV